MQCISFLTNCTSTVYLAGVGRNDLEMANAVLALTIDYTTRTATAGAALSGVYDYEQYDFRPELAFSYGHTLIGNVGCTGCAYGLADDTLSIANLTLLRCP